MCGVSYRNHAAQIYIINSIKNGSERSEPKLLQHACENTQEVENAARYHKHMKNSMHIAVLLAFAVEYRADGIQHAADEQVRETLFAYCLIGGFRCDDYAPAEPDIAYH